MSLQQAKNALVSSLFELSNAATEAATATVNFYKAAGIDGDASALTHLSESITGAAHSALDAVVDANGDAKKKPRAKKTTKKTDEGDAERVETPEENGDEEPAKTQKSEKAEKPKRKRAEKDPNAPKKPLTSYLRFNLSVREKMRKERLENGQPTYPATELNQIIADRWANLGEEGKGELQKAYESEFEVYKKALEQYNKDKADGKLPEPAEKESEAKDTKEAKTVKVKEPKETKEKKEHDVKDVKKKKSAKKVNGDAVSDAIETTAEELVKSVSKEDAPKKVKKRKDKEGDDKKTKKKKSE